MTIDAMVANFAKLRFEAPFVMEGKGTRSMHFTMGEVQSRMNLDRSDELQIDYTRTMMGFLLLNPQPRNITMIGLGGGSQAKFCHRYLPAARITVVENNPTVIALRRQFDIPDDDERLQVLADEGADFLRTAAGGIDVLLVDGFDHLGQPAQLCSQAFYDDCFQALAEGGVMAVNLHADDLDHRVYLQRIAASFQGNAMQVLAWEKFNCIVLAGRGRPVTIEALRSREWADVLDPQLQRQLRGEFAHIGWHACGLGAI